MLYTLVSCTVLSACGGGDGASSAAAPSALVSPASVAATGLLAAPRTLPEAAPVAALADAVAAASLATAAPEVPMVAAAPADSVNDAPVLMAELHSPLPSEELLASGSASSVSARVMPPRQSATLPGDTPITTVAIQNTGASQAQVPVTFGHVFAAGHVPAGQSVTGRLADGTSVPLQVDAKARHPDGSLRHGVISAVIARLTSGQTHTMTLMKTAASASAPATAPTALLNAGFTANASIVLNGTTYSASADSLLRSGTYKTWLSGQFVNEWQVAAPLKSASGVAHPHLVARFAIRAVNGSPRARVDVAIENAWAYEAAPQNFTYDVSINVGGTTAYSKKALTHFHHARWRHLAWWGTAPQVHVRHNTAYLIATKAVPNYDQSIVIPETVLAGLASKWTGAVTEPMFPGLAVQYMPTTGGRNDIGLLPSWSAIYLLSMDKRAKEVMLGTADRAGSYAAHYRNRNTDRPVSVVEFPHMTLLGRASDTYNPVTKKLESFPVCATTTACAHPATVDRAHQPAFAYLPYLVTGDYYYLEELQFFGMWNVFAENPHYRQYAKGVVSADQIRGQAWSMRTLGEAAYITPDADPLKAHFMGFVSNNLDYYNANYSNSATANKLGVLLNGHIYYNHVAIAPWQDDFFTSAIGHLSDLGFTKAAPLLAYKSKFSIERMTGDGACWIDAAAYNLKVRDSSTSPVYTSIKQVFTSTETSQFNTLNCDLSKVATFFKLAVGEMTGYSTSQVGYPSNMQPALAYSAQINGSAGVAAWNLFMSRRVKPNYAHGPQFAIVPR